MFPNNKADFCVSKKRKEENEVFLKPFALANAFLSLRSSASGGLKPFSEEKGFKNSKKTLRLRVLDYSFAITPRSLLLLLRVFRFQRKLRVHLFHLIPNIDENLRNQRVKILTRAVLDNLKTLVQRHCLAVTPSLGNRVKHVRNGHNSRANRNILPAQPVGITLSRSTFRGDISRPQTLFCDNPRPADYGKYLG